MSIKPCLLILSYTDQYILKDYVLNAINFCQDIFVPMGKDMDLDLPITYLDMDNTMQKQQLIMRCIDYAKASQCTHIISMDIDTHSKTKDLQKIIETIYRHSLDIIVGVRDFSDDNICISKRLERHVSAFWLRVQTSVKLQDIHHNTRAYPIIFFDFARIGEQGYAFDVESLVRAAWGGFHIRELAISNKVGPKSLACFRDHIGMIVLNIHLTLRALVPLPFRRYGRHKQERVSLRHPIKALRQLMNDPYNRATPWQLARTAGISMAILTVPAPIVQSIFLLLSIGWLKLNRLCAIAMIPLTWPPFLPGLAILVGYRLRHGHWLTEFNIQTLGYEIGQRLWEWVIGSLVLTPILGLFLGCVVGILAWLATKIK